jgi:hypothetical protein
MIGLVALENQLNSSINYWLRFLGPLQAVSPNLSYNLP